MMIQEPTSTLWTPKRRPIVTLDDVAGKPLSPSERAALQLELTQAGRGTKFGRSVQCGRSLSASPLTILGSLAWWVRADQGITLAAGVSQWNDLSGNGVNFAQGTAGFQPALVASAINGRPAVQSDGVDDALTASWARVAPGTQPFYLWLVCRQDTWSSNDYICGDFSGNGFAVVQNVGSPTAGVYNSSTASTNSAATLGSFFRWEAQLQNTIADYLKIGSTNATGTSSSNQAGSGNVALFNSGPIIASRYAAVTIAEAFIHLGTPDVSKRTELDAYCTARYGSGLV